VPDFILEESMFLSYQPGRGRDRREEDGKEG
jgi:hypothetical protein